MAIQTFVLAPATTTGTTATLAATTASSAIAVGQRAIFAFVSSGPVTIVFGLSTGTGGAAVPTPSATAGFYIPANFVQIIDMTKEFDSFAIYNAAGSSVTYSYIPVSRF
jgi:hypothetical protein